MPENDSFREKIIEEPDSTLEVTETTIDEPKEASDTVNQTTPEDKPMDEEGDKIRDLTIWEGENNKKFVNEYFDTHNIYNEFEWKMLLSKVDKFVKSEIETKELANTIDNYRDIVQNLENVIQSNKLNLSKRLNKIVGYINITKKLYKDKELEKKYLSP